MEKERFPERPNLKDIQLKKEIYKREEKVLGLALSSEKARFQNFLRNIKPRFGGVLEETQKSNGESSGLSISNSRDQYDLYKKRNISELVQKIRESSPSPSNKSKEFIYKSSPWNAIQYKKKYELYNRSPITWLAKQDLLNSGASERHPNSTQNSAIYSQLNSKKILKGMGYIKTNIFNN
jgi:hypothetical protein